jgi:hypothetical protein
VRTSRGSADRGARESYHCARSSLSSILATRTGPPSKVKTRRLLAANGLTDYIREAPLAWEGREYAYDFVFESGRVILETNGRRWHDDPTDYEHDHEKWSVPGRYGYKLVLATWDKVVHPAGLIAELRTTLAA